MTLSKNAQVHQPGGAGVQGDVGQVLGTAGDQAVHQLPGAAVEGKAAGHNGLAVVKTGDNLIPRKQFADHCMFPSLFPLLSSAG